jgi:hypothetical protein
MDRRKPARQLRTAAQDDPRAVAAHDHLCQAADLLEELYKDTRDNRLFQAISVIDLTRRQLKGL